MSRLGKFLEKHRTSATAGGLVALATAILLWRRASPSNQRIWVREQERLAYAELRGDWVLIRNVRCFRWNSDESGAARYEDRRFDLGALRTLDFIISRFGMNGLAAHTMLSFGFEGGQRIVASVEVRRRAGQHYSFLQGLLRSFELMYIFADERDVVRLRTNIRNEPTYLYPVDAAPEQLRNLFVRMLDRANELSKKPEFYHSVANACTTNLIRHFNEVGLCHARSSGPRSVLSGLSDSLLHDLGLIGRGMKLKEMRRSHRINARAHAYGDGPRFSEEIRA